MKPVTEPKPRVTADHKEIRKWAEARGGQAAVIKNAVGAATPGEPRFKFAAEEDRMLGAVAWEDFFREFDRRKLAMLYISHPESEDEDTFFRFVDRDVDFEDSIRPIDDDGAIVWNEGKR